MNCPFCKSETKVSDSRLSVSENKMRRRRQCLKCHEKFTTYESIDMNNDEFLKKKTKILNFLQLVKNHVESL